MVLNKNPTQPTICSSSKDRRAKTQPKVSETAKGLPRRSAYYGNKIARQTTDEQPFDEDKLSGSPVKVTENENHPKRSLVTATEKQPPPVMDSIFKTVHNPLGIAEDVIHADCMNHGYRIEKTVGEGAYAKVKLAEVLPSKLVRHEKLGEIAHNCEYETMFVAIKVIESKNVPKEFLKKFLPRELGNHCPLPAHPNVVEVYEQFRTADRYYVVMEYCNRGDLLELINQNINETSKGVGEDRARVLFKMMAEGVHHIHSNGIVHRDLKCENILLNHENNIKITDFGFSTKFTPDKTDLLKTSCGSYAYTAPEVIRMKPYDGTKSDAWSLGIILFAMLNGRLPFNDTQLSELEEDMKMQRLRFERDVSFESMVLVRRMLQYNPSTRPTTTEILKDPWLTGKRLIPRQPTKPKWVNPYHKKEEDDVQRPATPVYFKASIAKRGSDGTVTVNHDRKETVVLKSRTGSKKNVWTSGPPLSNRPNTWPKQDRAKQATRPRDLRYNKTKATAVDKQPGANKAQGQTGKDDNRSKKEYGKSAKYTTWFMEKYMIAQEAFRNQQAVSSKDCECCKAEVAARTCREMHANLDDKEPELCFHDNDDDVTPDVEDFRFPSPVKNVSDCEATGKLVDKIDTKVTITKSRFVVDRSAMTPKPPAAEQSKLTQRSISSRSGKISACSQRSSGNKTSSPTVKSSSVTLGPSTNRKNGYNAPVLSQSADAPWKNLVRYLANRPTTPAERVKYFRDRLMKLYTGKETANADDIKDGLPVLTVQSLKPQKPKSVGPQPPRSAPSALGKKRNLSTHTGKTRCKSSTIKPVQRVVVH